MFVVTRNDMPMICGETPNEVRVYMDTFVPQENIVNSKMFMPDPENREGSDIVSIITVKDRKTGDVEIWKVWNVPEINLIKIPDDISGLDEND